jgi:hypothetical protein
MPIFFLIVGVLLIIVAVNNKLPELTELIKEDFQPSGNQPAFHVWIAAIFIIGALGYIREFKPVANAFLVLIVVSMLLSNSGFFSQFTRAIEGK